MKSADMFPSKYLKAEEFDGDALVVIEKVVVEKLKDPKTREENDKPVAYFKDVDKGLVVNKTNWAQIAQQHGDESNDWKGKEITLTVMEVESFGEIVQAIRVKPKAQSKKGPGIGRAVGAATSESEAAERAVDEEAGKKF